jgi:uncharacterized coiled-coil protein SlyX
MRAVKAFAFLVLAAGMMWAQSTTSTTSTNSDNIAGQVQQLRDTLAAQQKQIQQQQEQIQKLQEQLVSSSSATAHVENAVYHPAAPPQDMPPKESPLSFRIGGADFTPGGFLDFENIFRTTNSGTVVGTSFGAMPFNNTIQGHLTEYRMSAQHSRFNLKVHDKFGMNDVTGYIEADFNGLDPANVFVSTNSHTNRLRLYWVDIKRGKWEFLGGQSWGMEMPNRVGLSPMPADIWVGLESDANAHVGIPYTREAQFRTVYHPNSNWAVGVAIENPDQFVNAGEVIFPFAFNAALGPQFDAANQTTVPNLMPDVVSKVAFDKNYGDRHVHFEFGGLMTTVKITDVPIGGTTFESHTKLGGGLNGAFNVDVVKNFKFLASGWWSEGGGRYLNGLAPNTVIQPIVTGPGKFDIEPDLVESVGAMGGFEWLATPRNQLYMYYGGMYADREAFQDSTSPLVIKPFIGFGGINSPNSANRAIQEGTLGWNHTIWKDQQHGALMFNATYSYLTRSPWFVAAGAPKNAHLSMVYLDLRYVLP